MVKPASSRRGGNEKAVVVLGKSDWTMGPIVELHYEIGAQITKNATTSQFKDTVTCEE